jgi:hypothetical protein
MPVRVPLNDSASDQGGSQLREYARECLPRFIAAENGCPILFVCEVNSSRHAAVISTNLNQLLGLHRRIAVGGAYVVGVAAVGRLLLRPSRFADLHCRMGLGLRAKHAQ